MYKRRNIWRTGRHRLIRYSAHEISLFFCCFIVPKLWCCACWECWCGEDYNIEMFFRYISVNFVFVQIMISKCSSDTFLWTLILCKLWYRNVLQINSCERLHTEKSFQNLIKSNRQLKYVGSLKKIAVPDRQWCRVYTQNFFSKSY